MRRKKKRLKTKNIKNKELKYFLEIHDFHQRILIQAEMENKEGWMTESYRRKNRLKNKENNVLLGIVKKEYDKLYVFAGEFKYKMLNEKNRFKEGTLVRFSVRSKDNGYIAYSLREL